MSLIELISLVVAGFLAFAWYLSYTAARLDRLHTRVEGTYAALDAQLVRRAEAVLEVANSGLLDPAGALILAGAASESLEGGELPQVEREAIESDLTRAIRLIVPAWSERAPTAEPAPAQPEPGSGRVGGPPTVAARSLGGPDESEFLLGVGEAALDRLDSAGQRVVIARRFHNDAVTDVLRLRDNPFVRLFRLAGYTELPRTVEFDDDLASAH